MPIQRFIRRAATGVVATAVVLTGCSHTTRPTNAASSRTAGAPFRQSAPLGQDLATPAQLDVATPVDTPTPVPPGRTVTASAIGTAEGSPDLLTVSVGVQTQARSAQAALSDNSGKAQALIAKLKSDGVADKDIQTAQLQVSPEYAGGGGAPFITGYQVTNYVTAKLRKLDRAGSLIDDAVAAAGDAARVNSISYSIDDDSTLLLAARSDAVRKATARAKAMAQAAGASLGPVRAIVDASSPRPLPMYGMAQGAAPRAAGPGPAIASAPVETGIQTLSVQVTVIFDLG